MRVRTRRAAGRRLEDRDRARHDQRAHHRQCRGRLGRRSRSPRRRKAVGIQPYRRTIAQLRVDPPAPADLPLIIDALGRFYFKPEAGGGYG
jgi:hypothetical protein